MDSEIIKFHNLHLPDEVRIFQIPKANIRVWDDKVMVYEVRFHDAAGDNLTFRHYSFYDKWFEINLTLDKNSNLIDEQGPFNWSFNCDICSPCFNKGMNLYNLDLELDILVSNDAKKYLIIDEDDFENVICRGFISEYERIGARRGLEGLVELITSGNLTTHLESICSFNDLISLSDPIPPKKLQISEVPLLSLLERQIHYGTRA